MRVIVKQYQVYIQAYEVEVDDNSTTPHADAVISVLDGIAEPVGEAEFSEIDELRGLSDFEWHDDELDKLHAAGYYRRKHEQVNSICEVYEVQS